MRGSCWPCPCTTPPAGSACTAAPCLDELVATPFHSEGYGFQIELVMRAWHAGWDLGEVPITFREREHGRSKISKRIVVEALWLVTVWGLKGRFAGLLGVRGDERP